MKVPLHEFFRMKLASPIWDFYYKKQKFQGAEFLT